MKHSILALGIATALASTAVQADTVTYQSLTTLPFTQADSLQAPGIGVSSFTLLTLPQFSPSLGTLTGMTINYSLTVQPDLTVTNLQSGQAEFSVTGNTNAIIFGFGGFVSQGANASDFFSQGLPAGGSTNFVLNSAALGGSAPIQLDDLTPFVGLDTFDINLSLDSGVLIFGQVTGSDPSEFFLPLLTLSVTTSGSVSVTYEYTALPSQVPEPGSMALAGLGLAGLALLRRRREVLEGQGRLVAP